MLIPNDSIAKYCAVLALVALAQPATSQELSPCFYMQDKDAKMACYHADLEKMKAEAAANGEEEPRGKWSVRKSKSDLDDKMNVSAILFASAKVGPAYKEPDEPYLEIRCNENTTAAVFYFGGYFMGDAVGMGQIDYRVDDRKAGRKNFDASTSNEHLGLWSGGRAIPFAKELLGGKSLYVKATPVNENPIDMRFDIDGVDAALKDVREACGW